MVTLPSVKLLFLVVTLLLGNPLTGETSVDHDLKQITQGTCEEAKADYQKYMDENHAALGIVGFEASCKTITIDPSKDQAGTT